MPSSTKQTKPVCFIASHFPQGGAERQILELMKDLIAKDSVVVERLTETFI